MFAKNKIFILYKFIKYLQKALQRSYKASQCVKQVVSIHKKEIVVFFTGLGQDAARVSRVYTSDANSSLRSFGSLMQINLSKCEFAALVHFLLRGAAKVRAD